MILDATDNALKKADVKDIMATAVSITSAADAVAMTFDSSENATFAGNIIKGNLTISGTEIDLSSGDLTIDVAGDITLDADGGDWKFADGGTDIGQFINSSSDFKIRSVVQDKDLIFEGNDGGSTITALTLDMSSAGFATFNNGITLKNELYINNADGSATAGYLYNDSNDFVIRSYSQDKDIIFKGNDGGSVIEAMRIDMSEGGKITTSGDIAVGADIQMANGRGISFAATSNSSGAMSSELLDDYEEGTWTPAWVATTSTVTVNRAVYTKIGNLVTVHAYISNISPATSGDPQYITGLPYTAIANAHYGAGHIVYSTDADVEGIGMLVQTDSTQMYFHYIDGSSGNAVTRANWNSIKSSGLALIFTATYRAAA